jgi:carboxypeptidase Q
VKTRLFILVAAGLAGSPAYADDHPDLLTVHKIRQEAFHNGQVMDHLFWLTDVNGPRLTGSPGFRSAADWAVKSLAAWGATKPHLETWGTFGRGWSLDRFSIDLVQPVYAPLHGVPRAWSGQTQGRVTSDIVLAPLFLKTERDERLDFAKVAARIKAYSEAQKGKLRGKIVLLSDPRDLEQPNQTASSRFDDPKLSSLTTVVEPFPPQPFEWPLTKVPADPKKRNALFASLPLEVAVDYWERSRRAYDPLLDFFRAEGVLAVLTGDDRGDGGLVFAEAVGSWELKAPIPPPWVVLAPEAYNRLARLAEKHAPAKVALDLEVRFHEDSPQGFNVIAEIPGRKKRDEVVMLGGHLDSWHAGTGATDNGAGSAVVLEAFRILKALDLPFDRTVRLALWSGEEQGLYGSRSYVKQHFADPVTMATKPEHAKLAAYFNLDNGSGKIRGIYLQENDMVRPIFEQWLAPFKDTGATTIAIRNTSGTDHLSFDAVGLPAFQFIQDPLDYNSRTHHSELDVYDHAEAGDLMQASAILATFVYGAATRAEMLPRKPMPKPLPPRRPAVAAAP